MTDENGKEPSSHTASSQPKAYRQWLTFREFVRHQEESGQQELPFSSSPTERYPPTNEERPAPPPLLIPPPVPLVELMDFLFASTMLFIFITMLLLFAI